MSEMQGKVVPVTRSTESQMDAAKLRLQLNQHVSPLMDKVDAKIKSCEATFGQAVDDKQKQISSVSGLKRLFTDPFGVRREKLRSQLAEADGLGAACITNAEIKVQADFQDEITQQRPKK